jgi:spermidine synthase
LYETDEPTIRTELATFFAAFPNGTVWVNLRDGLGYDMIFMGQDAPLKIDLDVEQARFNRPDFAGVRESLKEVGVNSMSDLLSTYTGNATSLAPWLKGAEISTDDDLRLSYLAGWGINADLADALYRKMLVLRKPPVDLFTGSQDQRYRLFQQMEMPPPSSDTE